MNRSNPKARTDMGGVLSYTLRMAICLYLYFQVLASVGFISLFWFSTELALGADSPPPHPWYLYALFGYCACASAALCSAILLRKIYGKWHCLYVVLALSMIPTVAISIWYTNAFYKAFHPLLLSGISSLMSALILAVVLSNRFYTFIFPPRTLPTWFKDATSSR